MLRRAPAAWGSGMAEVLPANPVQSVPPRVMYHVQCLQQIRNLKNNEKAVLRHPCWRSPAIKKQTKK